jgi:hypothetical protein
MSLGENVRQLRALSGLTPGVCLSRMFPDANGAERARIRQQLYRLEGRPERHSVLLLPLARLFGIAPDVLLNDDLSTITLEELDALRVDAIGKSLPKDLIALAEQISAASESARAVVRKVLILDHTRPARIETLNILLNDILIAAVRRSKRPDDSPLH